MPARSQVRRAKIRHGGYSGALGNYCRLSQLEAATQVIAQPLYRIRQMLNRLTMRAKQVDIFRLKLGFGNQLEGGVSKKRQISCVLPPPGADSVKSCCRKDCW